MEDLPVEIIQRIFLILDLPSYQSLSQSSRFMRTIALDPKSVPLRVRSLRAAGYKGDIPIISDQQLKLILKYLPGNRNYFHSTVGHISCTAIGNISHNSTNDSFIFNNDEGINLSQGRYGNFSKKLLSTEQALDVILLTNMENEIMGAAYLDTFGNLTLTDEKFHPFTLNKLLDPGYSLDSYLGDLIVYHLDGTASIIPAFLNVGISMIRGFRRITAQRVVFNKNWLVTLYDGKVTINNKRSGSSRDLIINKHNRISGTSNSKEVDDLVLLFDKLFLLIEHKCYIYDLEVAEVLKEYFENVSILDGNQGTKVNILTNQYIMTFLDTWIFNRYCDPINKENDNIVNIYRDWLILR